MRVAVVGSRGFPDLDAVRAFVNDLDPDVTVVSGGAPGVDRVAEVAALGRGLSVLVFPALWGQYGKRAGAIRNRQIVEAADRVVAFWDGRSPGTKITIEIARSAGKPLRIVLPRRVFREE